MPTATPARTPGTGRRVVASAGTTPLEELLAGELAGVRDDIQTFLAAHPDAAVEISWRPVQAAEEADGADSAEGAGEPR